MNAARRLFGALLGQRLALTGGRLDVSGPRGSITIRRDRHGIPYIEAENEHDGWFGLGFCQGQDRAFQIEMLVRLVRGTLASLVGKDGLAMDRLSRRIGFRRIGEAQVPLMPEATRNEIAAFARGVTEGVRRGSRGLAHEFALFFAEPTPFDAADVLGGAAFVAFALASNWDVELARLHVLLKDGPEAMTALESRTLDWMPVSSPPGALAGSAVDRLGEDLAHYRAIMAGASNNWAIAPSRTATGRPLLAADPHLPPVLPVHWYLAHVRTPAFAVCGACFIGQCGFSIGHNGVAAWAPTAAHHDTTDLFVEEMGPDGVSVRDGDRFVPCQVREELIEVRGGETVREKVLVTPRGPIVGPAIDHELGAVSMCATWLQPRGFDAQYRIHAVKNLDDMRAIHDPYPGTALSYVVANETGHIGWTLVGDAPIRKKGNGTVPLPGWDPGVGWEAHRVPMRDMPHVKDPPTGFVASANNQPVANGEGPFLGVDWLDGYRQARIAEVLGARSDWDAKKVQRLQLDQMSLVWRDVRDVVVPMRPASPAMRRALALLERWDGVVSADSPAAAVFELFLAEIIRRAVEAKAPRASHVVLGQGPNLVMPQTTLGPRRVAHIVALLRDAPPGWFTRSWAAEMADAMRAVVERLVRQRGSNPSAWAWGSVRPLTMKHTVSIVPGLSRVFDLGPVPWGGDMGTIAQGALDFRDPTGNPVGVPNLRFVVDVGNWDATRVVLAGGESGNPLSPHYGDLFELWKKGETAPLVWSPEAVRAASVEQLRLVPRRSVGAVVSEPVRDGRGVDAGAPA